MPKTNNSGIFLPSCRRVPAGKEPLTIGTDESTDGAAMRVKPHRRSDPGDSRSCLLYSINRQVFVPSPVRPRRPR